MNKTRLRTLSIAVATLALLALLAGCGNKGELVRPAPKADAPASS